MKEVVGNEGAKIVINVAPTRVVMQLRQCLAGVLKEFDIDVDGISSIEQFVKDAKEHQSKWLNLLKNIYCTLQESNRFWALAYECMKHCTYNDQMITERLFDDIPEARIDFDLIVLEVVKENLYPFFKSLLGKFAV